MRPYFHRLQRFRHAIELVPGQVGAAYFVAGNLVGVEVGPNPAYWADIGPILAIYCYGAAALLAERHQLKAQRQVVDLEGLTGVEDLRQRLAETRRQETAERVDLIQALSSLSWKYGHNEKQSGLRVVDLTQGEWAGQAVKDGQQVVYLSVFRDLAV
ncbi:MAG: hypothetical protein IMW89_22505 [Ktedonobacteraceae bacterium]|nr:hypothetical protein [Ktedonobacteraceae bacterium]